MTKKIWIWITLTLNLKDSLIVIKGSSWKNLTALIGIHDWTVHRHCEMEPLSFQCGKKKPFHWHHQKEGCYRRVAALELWVGVYIILKMHAAWLQLFPNQHVPKDTTMKQKLHRFTASSVPEKLIIHLFTSCVLIIVLLTICSSHCLELNHWLKFLLKYT